MQKERLWAELWLLEVAVVSRTFHTERPDTYLQKQLASHYASEYKKIFSKFFTFDNF